MSDKNSPKKKLEKAPGRMQWRFNHYVGLVLLVFIFIGVNAIGFKHFYRKNLSLNKYNAVGEQTINVVSHLPDKLVILNFVSPQSEDPVPQMIGPDVNGMLEDYRYQSKGMISVENVNPYLDPEKSRKVVADHKLTTQDNVLVLEYDGRSKVLNYGDLADVDPGFYGNPPKVRTFKAEQAITSAIQELVYGKKARVYFLSGHGEYDPQSGDKDDKGYSLMASYISRQNAEVAKLNLAQAMAIPEDADMLIVAGPKAMYSQPEVDLLDAYLEKKGDHPSRLVLMLDPQSKTGLESLLTSYGVTFDDDLAMTQVSILGQARLLPQAIATTFSNHPATEWIVKMGGINLNFGAARSLQVGAPQGGGASKAVALAMTPQTYWGEVEYGKDTASLDKSKDIPGPLTLAVAVDEGSVSGGEVNLAGARVLAIGAGAFLCNSVLGTDQVDFFLNGFNWLMGNSQSMGIAPKIPQEFGVKLTDAQKSTLSGVVLLLIPFSGLVLAVYFWWRSRK